MIANAAIIALSSALSYLLGSVPCGYLIARMKGIDIRRVGSGNIGATNVFRSVGKTWGLLTFLCDALKGFVPAYVFPILINRAFPGGSPNLLPILCACGAVAGHNWPIYLGFRGGKGVATSAGALMGIAPASMGIGLAAWALTFVLTRYVSVASIVAAVVVPASAWLLYGRTSWGVPVALTLLGLLAIARHHANIRRLLQGTESRFDFRKKSSA